MSSGSPPPKPGRQRTPPPWLYPQPRPAPGDPELRAAADAQLLDDVQRAAFGYVVDHADPHTGLVADASRDGSPSSIAVVGFALSAHVVGVERGWIDRADAVVRAVRVLRFFMESDQSGTAESTGHRGFYFHFLEMGSGRRTWQCELSFIDSALLIAGALTAAAYFMRAQADEAELRQLAEAMYRRVDWAWAQAEGPTVALGWKPEHGFLSYGWQGYSEALILYVLGLGSPTHPLDVASFRAWTMTYQWENLYGYDVLYAGPLFIHQLSHAWLDLRGIRDAFMREKHCDYAENSRRATYIQREYAVRNPLGFTGFADDCWGHSASNGPAAAAIRVDGRRQAFFGYAARGAPYGPDDGTLVGAAALGSLPFAPEIVMPLVRQLAVRPGPTAWHCLLASGFNATVSSDDGQAWVSTERLGLDQGLAVMMIENHRSDLLWGLGRANPVLRTGLERAGFGGGWLART